MAILHNAIAPWNLWVAKFPSLGGNLVVSIGYSRRGNPTFVGLKVAHGTDYLETLEVEVKDLPPMENLGKMLDTIPKWTHKTLCNKCGRDASWMPFTAQWVCNGRCDSKVGGTDPVTLESSQLREYLRELEDLLMDPKVGA